MSKGGKITLVIVFLLLLAVLIAVYIKKKKKAAGQGAPGAGTTDAGRTATPGGAPTFTGTVSDPNKVYKQGNTGADVKTIQGIINLALKATGQGGTITEDGNWGPQTTAALNKLMPGISEISVNQARAAYAELLKQQGAAAQAQQDANALASWYDTLWLGWI